MVERVDLTYAPSVHGGLKAGKSGRRKSDGIRRLLCTERVDAYTRNTVGRFETDTGVYILFFLSFNRLSREIIISLL